MPDNFEDELDDLDYIKPKNRIDRLVIKSMYSISSVTGFICNPVLTTFQPQWFTSLFFPPMSHCLPLQADDVREGLGRHNVFASQWFRVST